MLFQLQTNKSTPFDLIPFHLMNQQNAHSKLPTPKMLFGNAHAGILNSEWLVEGETIMFKVRLFALKILDADEGRAIHLRQCMLIIRWYEIPWTAMTMDHGYLVQWNEILISKFTDESYVANVKFAFEKKNDSNRDKWASGKLGQWAKR